MDPVFAPVDLAWAAGVRGAESAMRELQFGETLQCERQDDLNKRDSAASLSRGRWVKAATWLIDCAIIGPREETWPACSVNRRRTLPASTFSRRSWVAN